MDKTKKIFIFSIILSLLFLIFSNIYKVKAIETNNTIDQIVDTANIIKDPTIVMGAFNNLETTHKIKAYVYTIKKATQEDFELTMNEYSSNIQEDFILFYFSKDNANVGIYVSDNLKNTINDANKTIMLKGMEPFIATDLFDQAIVSSIGNIIEILNITNQPEIEHEVLEIEDKSTQRITSIIGMGSAIVLFIIVSIILIRSIVKEKKEKEIQKKEEA